MLCKPVELWPQESWRGSSGVQAAASPQHPSRCCFGDRSCTFLSSNLLFVHNCTHTFSSLLTLPNSPHPQQMPPASIELLLLCFLTHGSGPKAFILSIPLSLRERPAFYTRSLTWVLDPLLAYFLRTSVYPRCLWRPWWYSLLWVFISLWSTIMLNCRLT